MPVQQLQIPSSNINNLVDPSTWTGLSNLGNVYQEAQDRARQRATLASLGTDPMANTAALLKSGDPTLVRWGLQQQQAQTENTRAEAELNIRKAAEARAQGDYDQAEEYRQRAAELNRRMLEAGTGLAAPGGPSPFPAPLPGRNIMPPGAVPPQGVPVMPPAIPPGMPSPAPPAAPPTPSVQPGDLDARIAQSAQRLSGSGAAYPGITPTPAAAAAVTPPAIPIKAQGEDTGLPAWVGNQSTIGRMANTLTTGRPTATAGISNEELGEALANPETKAIATVFAQNKLNPGTWTVHHDAESGRFIAFNDKTQESRDVTPPLPGGAQAPSKQAREMQSYYEGAKAQGYSDEQAHAIAVNKGKLPSEDLHPDERKQIKDLTDIATGGESVIRNLDDLKQISPKAWGHPGALEQAKQVAGYLPEAITPSGAIQTMNLANAARMNVATQAKSIFGPRLAVAEVKMLDELEGTANQPDAVRQLIFNRAKTMLQDKVAQARAEAEGIRNKTFFKPGGDVSAPSVAAPAGAAAAAAAAPAAPAAPAAKPSLKEFMDKARVANPGVSDGELARYWKSKYGG